MKCGTVLLMFWTVLGMIPPATAQERLVAHVTAENGLFSTTIIIANAGGEPAGYQLLPYSAGGQVGEPVSGEIGPFQTQYFEVGDLFDQHPSHFAVSGDTGIRVRVAYRVNEPDGSPAHVAETAAESTVWRLYPGDWNVVWDGAALVNLGQAPTSVTLYQMSAGGTVAAQQRVSDDLAVLGKLLFVLGDHFTALPEAHYLVVADQPVVLTALRGSLDAKFLWQNLADADPLPAGPASYRVTFESTWSAQTHPRNFPPNPHFSGLIGATHHGGVTFWAEGAPASPGMEVMAESGGKSPLLTEINTAIQAGNAQTLISGGGIGTSPGSVSLTFDIDAAHPLVTLVSMLGPSPDWFVGVKGLSLWENGSWAAAKTVPLFIYDAGTDSGSDYSSADQDTQPAEPIHMISDEPFLVNGTVVEVGRFIFTRE